MGKPNAGAGCCYLVCNGILAYFFYTYSSTTDSPDGDVTCWAVTSKDSAYSTKALAMLDNPTTNSDDILDITAKM